MSSSVLFVSSFIACLGRWCRLTGSVLALWLGVLMVGQVAAQDDFLDPEQAFALTAAVTANNELDIHFAIAPDYYMYRARFEVLPAQDGVLDTAQFPPGEMVDDPTFGEIMEVYRHGVTIRSPLMASVPPGSRVAVDIVSQGCADAGLCYPPARQQINLVADEHGYRVDGPYGRAHVPGPDAVSVQTPPSSTAQGMGVFQLNDIGLAQYLQQAGWLHIVVISFVLGVLLSFTPCVLPMVPILLAAIAGTRGDQPVSRWQGLSLALAYVLGLSIVYALLGVLAGMLGAGLAMWMQTPWVVGVFALILALLGLSMLDIFTVQMHGGLQSYLSTRINRLPGGQYGGVFLMGMLSALILGPCVAAPLAGVLLFISQTGDLVLGGSALFALAWGSGVLLLVLGAGSGALLPRAGEWMNRVKTVFALLLFATAWWMLSPFLGATTAVLGWALFAFWAALMLGLGQALQSARPLAALAKALGLILAVWAVLMLIGAGLGQPSVLRPLQGLGAGLGSAQVAQAAPVFQRVQSVAQLNQHLAQTQRPVLLDFYADWCVSCLEMERFTFTDGAVAQRMAQFELLQVDVTHNTAEDRALLQQFQLFGPPGILFFDARGQYLPADRVIGFKNADQFRQSLDTVLAKSQAGTAG